MGVVTDIPDTVPPGWLARRSSRVFAGALALAIAAAALTVYQAKERRAFAEPTTNAMGTVLRGGAVLPHRRGPGGGYFCFVSYEFTPASGGAAQQNWRLWEPGCGASRGRPILIEHLIARPEVNRPAGETDPSSALYVWFAAGVALVIGFLVRSSRDGD